MTQAAPFQLAGIIGFPVAQSRAPVIQNFWLDQHGIAGRYMPIPVTPFDKLAPGAIVGALIYIPLETPFLAAARARGNVTVNGLGPLLNQARLAFEAWFDVRPEITPALLEAVAATF